jgi:hypothetical protein
VGIETLNIDELPSAAALSGADLIELQQGAQGVRLNLADIINFIVTTDAFNNAVALRIPAFLEDYFDFGTDDLTILTNVNIAGDLYVNGDQIYQWQKISNPPTGWLDSKTSGITVDRFNESDGGMTTDFSSAASGAIAVLVSIYQENTRSSLHTRPAGDTNYSNTPFADDENSCYLMSSIDGRGRFIIFLNGDGKADFALGNTGQDVYIAYPTVMLVPLGS